MVISQELVPWFTIGYFTIAAVGGILCFFWILGIAFSEGILHGLGCLICGPYGLYYCVTRWHQCRLPLLITLVLNVGLVAVQVRAVDTQPISELFTTVEKLQQQARQAQVERTALDQQALQGAWRLALSELPDSGADFEEFRFVEDRCVVQGREGVRQFRVVLARSPQARTIDLTNMYSGEQLKGIYRLNGDHFTLCVSGPGESRPQHFASWGSQQRSFVLRRSESQAPEAAGGEAAYTSEHPVSAQSS